MGTSRNYSGPVALFFCHLIKQLQNLMFFLSSIFSTYLEGSLQLLNFIFLLTYFVLAGSDIFFYEIAQLLSIDQDVVFKAELGMHTENIAQLTFAKNILF